MAKKVMVATVLNNDFKFTSITIFIYDVIFL